MTKAFVKTILFLQCGHWGCICYHSWGASVITIGGCLHAINIGGVYLPSTKGFQISTEEMASNYGASPGEEPIIFEAKISKRQVCCDLTYLGLIAMLGILILIHFHYVLCGR